MRLVPLMPFAALALCAGAASQVQVKREIRVQGQARAVAGGRVQVVSIEDQSAPTDGPARLDARTAIVLAEIASVAEASEAQIAQLEAALKKLIAERAVEATKERKPRNRAWAAMAFDEILGDVAWRAALEEALSETQRAALDYAESDRTTAVQDAQADLATALLAAELRLREPQMLEVSRRIVEWAAQREPTRAERLSGDAVAEIMAYKPVRSWLLPEQINRSNRMRSAKRPTEPSVGAPGDDLPLGRGRFAEDDFVLEACALRMFRGWEPEGLDVLENAATQLARSSRRKGGRSSRFGDVALFKERKRPSDSEFWNALVQLFTLERHAGSSESLPDDPGPWATGKADSLVDARIALIIAHLDDRLRLSDEQQIALLPALRAYVAREYVSRTNAFGALDAETIWTELRFVDGKDPRRGGSSRKRLCEGLCEVLTDVQVIELGVGE